MVANKNQSHLQRSKDFWKFVENSRYLPSEHKLGLNSVSERNAYFAHAENFGFVKQMDTEYLGKSVPCTNQMTQIDFETNIYIDLTDWQHHFYDPLRDVTDNEINKMGGSHKGNFFFFLRRISIYVITMREERR